MKTTTKTQTKKNKVNLVVILDKSGSMEGISKQTISGVNEYLGDLIKDEKAEYTVSMTLFDTTVERLFKNEKLSKKHKLDSDSYRTGGGTALYDAVVETIRDVTPEMSSDRTLCIIVTDGEENSSRTYNEKDLSLQIKTLENKGWKFVFLGANQDSFATSKRFGISNLQDVSNFKTSDKGIQVMFSSLSTNTRGFASGTMTSNDTSGINFFSKKDQDNLNKA